MKNNKGIWIGAVVFILVMAVLCACIVLLTPSGAGSYMMIGGSAALRNTTELEVAEGTELELTTYSDNIYFYESNNNQLVIKEYYKIDNKNVLAEITRTDNKVIVQGTKKTTLSLFGWFGDGDRIEIYLPAGYISKIQTSVSSGNIRSELAYAGKEFSLEAKSGNITWNSIQAETIQLKTSSGNIRVEYAAGETTAKANSGNITIERADGFVTAGASSGNVKVLEAIGGADINISSGNAHLEVIELKNNINVSTSSGNIKIQVPSDSEFTFRADTNSGNIDTTFDEKLSYNKRGNSATGTVGGNPEYEIVAKASSGNVKVTR